MYLFFDTETTGLPLSWSAPVTKLDNWPRMVQIAWMLFDNRDPVVKASFVIKPEGFRIPADAARIHGITTEIAKNTGISLSAALMKFSEAIDASDLLIAHNIDFDEKIVGAEFLRMKIRSSIFNKQRFCTMKRTVDICRIPGNYGYKFPTLVELYACLFKKKFKDAHDASADAAACADCFFKLKDLGYINI